ncbi:pirin family protein [Flavobacterium alkalisoli]|uniref:Pirin family protein n=1 Tax=Flavobacterium alkalisoli TaxID=2602769 RepID=A0A5B9FVS0_9FLAO|nr:pirin family protein [Flavobacterium alkalisoli]QEE50261.1 pirin family protein [Flavobacterium alkalisoli]
MKKKTSFSTKGQRADIGELTIYRLLANRYSDAVGPFVFLDHIVPKVRSSAGNTGTGAHPHRGIATLSYIIEGEDEHFDSAGNYAKVYSGGIQWMKAGNGIIHDETLNTDSQSGGNSTHAFQFWINLPSENKAEKPEYLAIQRSEVPQKALPGGHGSIKVIAGDYEELHSRIPDYSKQFLYHIELNPTGNFILSFDQDIEVAAVLPIGNMSLNGVEYETGEFVEFDRDAGEIVLENTTGKNADVLLFGGEHYREPIVAEGPFVMNSAAGIAEAYRDYYAGKYGRIKRPESGDSEKRSH